MPEEAPRPHGSILRIVWQLFLAMSAASMRGTFHGRALFAMKSLSENFGLLFSVGQSCAPSTIRGPFI